MCNDHIRLHPAEVPDVVQLRPVLAELAMDARGWEHFSRFFQQNPGGILGQAELSGQGGSVQSAWVILCRDGDRYWRVRDPLLWGEGVWKISKRVPFASFHDVFFYLDDLPSTERTLFCLEPDHVEIQVQRPMHWVLGSRALGWTVNAETLQVEWLANWGPMHEWNLRNASSMVRPGHRILSVNGPTAHRAILFALEHDCDLVILLGKLGRGATE